MNHRPRITCNNGVSLSVQANEYTYCTPRTNEHENWESYTHVEVGFIKNSNGKHMSAPDTWLPYSDDGTLDADVYAYVPVELVKQFIEANNKT